MIDNNKIKKFVYYNMKTNKRLELIGWVIFILSAIGFIIQNKNSFWGIFASICFLIGSLFFISSLYLK